MIGDKLVITDYHRAAAAKAVPVVLDRLARGEPVAVSVAGESGCGKSETAQCLAEALGAEGKRCVVLCQDDYFRLPPKTNHARRERDISWVGPGEVRLELMDEHVSLLKRGLDGPLTKPLVNFDEDRIDSETIEPGGEGIDVVIVEGTYTSLLESVDVRVFIDRTYRQTKKARLRRGRDPDVGFLERVLEIEHAEISRHKARADVVIDPPEDERED